MAQALQTSRQPYTCVCLLSRYGLGSADFEDALIEDCFGPERAHEYRGKHKLDCVLVVGIDPALLATAPGGRHNARVSMVWGLVDHSIAFMQMHAPLSFPLSSYRWLASPRSSH